MVCLFRRLLVVSVSVVAPCRMSEAHDSDGPPVIDPSLPVDEAVVVVLSPEAKKAQAEALKRKALRAKEAEAAFLRSARLSPDFTLGYSQLLTRAMIRRWKSVV